MLNSYRKIPKKVAHCGSSPMLAIFELISGKSGKVSLDDVGVMKCYRVV
jgi:hypothetical protein